MNKRFAAIYIVATGWFNSLSAQKELPINSSDSMILQCDANINIRGFFIDKKIKYDKIVL